MQEILSKVAKELNLPVEEVSKVYKAYWLFIRQKIEALPLKEELTEQEFNNLKTNFNIPGLGKLSCDYERWQRIKKKQEVIKKIKDDQYQENQSHV